MAASGLKSDAIGLGILGCGAIAQCAHVPAALRARRVRLVAMCDAAEDLLARVADRAGVAGRYTSYEAMLADPRIDAVVIAAPDVFHVPLAIRGLEAGKHVLVEKPLGETSQQCLDLLAVQRRTGLTVQVGSMKRHDPGVAFARRFIRDRLGPILSVSGVYRDSLFRPDMQAATLDPVLSSAATIRPARDPKADGARYNLVTQGAHLFDTILHLAGPIAAVTVRTAAVAGQRTWHGLMEFAAGGAGHFELTCKSSGDWCERYELCGETGTVEVNVPLPFYHRPAEARCFDAAAATWTGPLGGRSNAYANQLEAFAAAILDDGPVSPDVEEGLAAVRVLEAVEVSLAVGGRVACATYSRGP